MGYDKIIPLMALPFIWILYVYLVTLSVNIELLTVLGILVLFGMFGLFAVFGFISILLLLWLFD